MSCPIGWSPERQRSLSSEIGSCGAVKRAVGSTFVCEGEVGITIDLGVGGFN